MILLNFDITFLGLVKKISSSFGSLDAPSEHFYIKFSFSTALINII